MKILRSVEKSKIDVHDLPLSNCPEGKDNIRNLRADDTDLVQPIRAQPGFTSQEKMIISIGKWM